MSKAWGKNVGDMPPIECISGALFVTNGGLPQNGCLVEEVVTGTFPLSGYFRLSLDTSGHPVINVQRRENTGNIAHNAVATASDSNGDGTSVEEILEALYNVGDVSVSRSVVNTKNGGYTWTVTFLRDDSNTGIGQFSDCEQRDDAYNLCNSPGNVPALFFDPSSNVQPTCQSGSGADAYACHYTTIITDDVNSPLEPPGSKEIHRIYTHNVKYDAGFGLLEFSITFSDGVNTQTTACMPVISSATVVQSAIHSLGFFSASDIYSRGVRVTEKTGTVNAKNGKVYTIYYFNEGNIPDITLTQCTIPIWNGIVWSATPDVVRDGARNGLTKATSGVINGVVARDDWDELYVSGETQSSGSGIKWNALPEATSVRSQVSIKTHIETASTHKVNVKRIVIGKYGAVEYEIRFVQNDNQYPSGAGDGNDLVVSQLAATDGQTYTPVQHEDKKGSIGITGSFLIDLHDINGPRKVAFDESALRLRRKLEEKFTIGKVYVERSNYPSSTTGGWGANPVADGTFGGYEWRFYFVRNTGNYNDWTFPAGSGNFDPLSVTFRPGVDIFGTKIKVQSVSITEGSVPIDGQFALTYNGSTTAPLTFNQQPLEAEALIESLKNIGDVDVSQRNRAMHKLDGVWASVNRDSMTLDITYDSDKPNADVRQMLADGDLIRVGGVPSVDVSGEVSIDGATVYSIATVQSGSPVIKPVDNVPLALPGETLRLGADNYTVVGNGAEVQVVSITCTDGSSACGKFRLKFSFSGTDYYSTCIKRDLNQDITSANDLQASFSLMDPVFPGGVIVTRTASFDFRSFVYSIYFEGPSVFRDVNELAIDTTGNGCSGGLVPLTSATVFTAIQGGNTEVKFHLSFARHFLVKS